MPTLTMYPTSVDTEGHLGPYNFNNPTNVVGDTTSSATRTLSATNYQAIHGFNFDASGLPSGAVITKVTIGIIARVSAASTRVIRENWFLAVGTNNANMYIGDYNAAYLTTTFATYLQSFTPGVPDPNNGYILPSQYFDGELWRTNAIKGAFSFGFNSGSEQRTVYWQKFWIELEYVLPTGNALFTGELF